MPSYSSSFLICHRGALGDFILTWPTLYAVKKILPHHHFLGLGRPEYMRLAMSLGLLDSCLPMESAQMLDFFSGKSIPPEIGSPQGALLWLSQGKKTADLLQKFASLPVVLVNPFPAKTSYQTLPPSPLPYADKKLPVALYHLLAVQAHFPTINLPPLSLCFSLQIKKGSYALIHPGSGSPTKNYSPQFYQDMAEALPRFGYRKVHFIFGPAEENLLAEKFPKGSIQCPKNVVELANLLAGAALYIGNDSGVSHLSGILGTPTIALYKTTDSEIWGALGKKVVHISALDERSAFDKIHKYLRDNTIIKSEGINYAF
ncbi:MAG: glycosyltransferase family 9 protein [Deltaproteobacteria bacterium]|nr:glycosyltransferase family 9 protein [Deltaproteobacteria bacterium]